jgi:hypothetical protein
MRITHTGTLISLKDSRQGGAKMLVRKKWWLLCLPIALLILLPDPGFGKRRPLVALFEAPTKGEGKRYVPSHEGQMVRGTVLEGWRIGQRKDTTEIWLVERKDDTVSAEGPQGRFVFNINVNVVVQAEVTFDSTRGDYLYCYTLHSLKTSPTEADNFEVVFDPDLPFSDFAAPQTKPNRWAAWAQEKESNPEEWKQSGQPLRWYGGISPGESVGGFSFRSPVLPGVVHCWSDVVTPDLGWGGYFLGGSTLGPVGPSKEFHPEQFSKKIASIIDESVSEGWIEDESFAVDLKKTLGTSIESGNENRIESTLLELLKKVEEEKDHSLLSEAYALLKYNMQYMLEQLEKGDKGKE